MKLQIRKIPEFSNPHFTGRTEKIQQLAQAVEEESISVVHGLGGIGKTQLVYEYVQSMKSKFDIIYWIEAEEPSKLKESLLELGFRLGVIKEKISKGSLNQNIGHILSIFSRVDIHQEMIQSFDGNHLSTIDWLNNNGSWLLIYDNVDSLKDIENLYPNNHDGKIIVTSRNSQWPKTKSIELSTLSKLESEALINKITSISSDPKTSVLAREMGHLPLALEQSGAYIKENGISISEYLALFQEAKTKVFEDSLSYTIEEKTIATTWNVTIDKIKEEDDNAYELLIHCAFLEPIIAGSNDGIPLRFFLGKNEEGIAIGNPFNSKRFKVFKIENQLQLRKLIRILSKYSMCKYHSNVFKIHRLVQMVTRSTLDNDDIKSCLLRLQIMADIMFEFVWVRGKSEYPQSEYYSTASTIVKSCIDHKIFGGTWAVLYLRLIQYQLFVLNDYRLARDMLDQLKSILMDNQPISNATWADYFIYEALYSFEIKEFHKGLGVLRKADNAMRRHYSSFQNKKEEKEMMSKYHNILLGICSLLTHYNLTKEIAFYEKWARVLKMRFRI